MEDRRSSRRLPVMAVVLAAGKGTRMRSATPKVLHTIGGEPILSKVLKTSREAGVDRVVLVLGHGGREVRDLAARIIPDAQFVTQEPQLGTGHALMQCLGLLGSFSGSVLVLSGDVPGLRPQTIKSLIELHSRSGASVTLLTARLDDPAGYGRILRESDGSVSAIREQRDLEPGQESINEVNMGVYAFKAPFLVREIPRLTDSNAQREYYLTDLIQAANQAREMVAALVLDEAGEAMGINTFKELAAMERDQRIRTVQELMAGGVRVMDPETAYVEATVIVEPDAVLHPMVFLYGSTRIGAGTVVFPGAVIRDSTIGPGVEVRPYSVITESEVAEGASVGPFAHLRPGTRLGKKSRIGNFVEVKKSVLGDNSKASHLTYIGDSTLGRDVNIGAGCVTCNYDGFSKHATVIEDGVFVGSGCMLVAPVTLGRGSLVAAGSTITKDVPADALALARSRQEDRPGWVTKWREKKIKEKEEKKMG